MRETYGPYVGPDFAIILVTEEGIRAAFAADGRVQHGAQGMAGEIGHIEVVPPAVASKATTWSGFTAPCWCGRPNHLDAFATPIRIRAEINDDAADTTDLVTLAEEHPARADEVFAAAGRCLGHALVTFVDLVDPAQLVLVLPPAFGQDAGQNYVTQTRAALSSAFSTGGTDTQLELRFLSGQIASYGARAVAFRLIIEFIDHLSGTDGCLPKERNLSTWLARGGAASVGGALGNVLPPWPVRAVPPANGGSADVPAPVRANRSTVGQQAQVKNAPWFERTSRP